MSKAKLDATGHRWLSSLASYDFNIVYRPGSSNVDADILSRYPGNQDCTEIHNDSVKATFACTVTPPFHTIMSVDNLEATEFPGRPMAQVDMREIRKEQLNDSLLGFWVRAVRDKNRPQRSGIHSRAMLKYFDTLKLIRGILYRETGIESEKKCQRVAIDFHRTSIIWPPQ